MYRKQSCEQLCQHSQQKWPVPFKMAAGGDKRFRLCAGLWGWSPQILTCVLIGWFQASSLLPARIPGYGYGQHKEVGVLSLYTPFYFSIIPPCQYIEICSGNTGFSKRKPRKHLHDITESKRVKWMNEPQAQIQVSCGSSRPRALPSICRNPPWSRSWKSSQDWQGEGEPKQEAMSLVYGCHAFPLKE